MQENINLIVATGFWGYSVALVIVKQALTGSTKKRTKSKETKPQNMSFVANNNSTIFFG